LKNVERNELSGITSFRSEKSLEIFNKLLKEKITAANREGIVRFSPHFYNTFEEIDKVVYYLGKFI
jgi:selenocysteine lyase/cysteine desulfurase